MMNGNANWLKLALPLGAALVLGGCPSGSGPNGNADACEVNADCDPGLVCTDGACAEFLTCELKQAGCKKNCAATSATSCTVSADCAAGKLCVAGACADPVACAGDEFCFETTSGAECRKAGCRVAADCSGGDVCLDGECKPKSAITDTPDECVVTNQARTFATNAVVPVTAVALKAGKVIPYSTDFTVTLDAAATAFTLAGTSLTATATAGSADVTVAFGSVTCVATFANAGQLLADTHRVVLYRTAGTNGLPEAVTGFNNDNFKLVRASGAAESVTATPVASAPGTYLITTAAAVGSDPFVALSILSGDYNAASIYFGNGFLDAAVPLEPLSVTTGFGGEPAFADFDKEFPTLAKAQIALAFAGGSLPLTSLLNFNVDLFIGDLAPKALSLESLNPNAQCNVVTNAASDDFAAFVGQSCAMASDCGPAGTPLTCDGPTGEKVCTDGRVPLPRALYLAYSNARFGPNCDGVAVRAIPGRRIGWSLGTKLPFEQIGAIAGLVTGDTLDIGAIIGGVLPLFDNFSFGSDSLGTKSVLKPVAFDTWKTYREKNLSSAKGDTANFPFLSVAPAKRLKFTQNFGAVIPDDFAPGVSNGKLNGMITLVAAVSPAYGIVPLGVGAGVDQDGDGKLDSLSPGDPRFPAEKVHTRFSAPSAEVADSDVIAVLAATNFADLTSDAPQSSAVRVKGVVARDRAAGIGWSGANPTFPSVQDGVQGVTIPVNATYSLTANTITLPELSKTAAGADADVIVLRISRDGAKRYWTVIVDASAIADNATIRLPTDGLTTANDIIVADKTTLSFTATALKFSSTANFKGRIGPASGKDLEITAGETAAFSLFLQNITKAN